MQELYFELIFVQFLVCFDLFCPFLTIFQVSTFSGVRDSTTLTGSEWGPHRRQKPARTRQLPISGQKRGGNALLKQAPQKRETQKNYWKWSLATMICLPKKKLKRQNHCLFHRHSEWAILLPFPNIVQFSLIFLFLRPRTEEEKQNNPQQLDSTTMLPNQRQY